MTEDKKRLTQKKEKEKLLRVDAAMLSEMKINIALMRWDTDCTDMWDSSIYTYSGPFVNRICSVFGEFMP